MGRVRRGGRLVFRVPLGGLPLPGRLLLLGLLRLAEGAEPFQGRAGKGNADGHQIADTEAQPTSPLTRVSAALKSVSRWMRGSGMRVSFSTSGITVHMATLAQP